MLFRILLILFIAIGLSFCVFIIIGVLSFKQSLLEEYKKIIAKYLLFFNVFHDVLEKDLDYSDIFAEAFKENSVGEQHYDEIHNNLKNGYFQFDIGNTVYVNAYNTKELRQAFVFAGNSIIDLDEFLKVYYDLFLDDEANDMYNHVILSTQYVRKICLAKNESAVDRPANICEKNKKLD